MLAAALVLAGAIWAFIAVANKMGGAKSQSMDERLMMLLRAPGKPGEAIGPGWLTDVAHDLSALGGPAVVALVVASVAGYLGIRRSTAAMWTVLGVPLGGAALAILLKLIVGRPRPDAALHLASAHGASFPSGHSIVSAVVYVTLGAMIARRTPGRLGKVYVLLLAMLVPVLVGVSRVYLGVHYPTDVAAGWAAGVAWALGFWVAARWRLLRSRGREVTG